MKNHVITAAILLSATTFFCRSVAAQSDAPPVMSTPPVTLEEKQAFQRSLFPRVVFWSKESSFFETGNRSLMSLISQMIYELKTQKGRMKDYGTFEKAAGFP